MYAMCLSHYKYASNILNYQIIDWINVVLAKQDHFFEHVESCLFLDSYGCHLKEEVSEHSYDTLPNAE
jgi:hypothetical protein